MTHVEAVPLIVISCLATSTLALDGPGDNNSPTRLLVLPGLDNLIGSYHGTNVRSGNSGDLNGAEGGVGNCNVSCLYVVLEVG